MHFCPLFNSSQPENEDINNTPPSSNEPNGATEAYTESMMTNDCSNLIALSNNNCTNGNAVDNTNGDTIVDNEFNKDQPDPDNIKMFVGQIPKSWDEARLRNMFEQYGRVHTLNVLRDKVTSVSRGELCYECPEYNILHKEIKVM